MCIPGSTRFLRVSTPTVPEPELRRRIWAFSRAAWPFAAQSRSWRSYFFSLSEGPCKIGGVCSTTTSVIVMATTFRCGRDVLKVNINWKRQLEPKRAKILSASASASNLKRSWFRIRVSIFSVLLTTPLAYLSCARCIEARSCA